jgi:hypothetical protein
LEDYEEKLMRKVEQLHRRWMNAEDLGLLESTLDSVVDVKTIKGELMRVKSFEQQISAHWTQNEIDPEENMLASGFIQTVEIYWNGRIERIAFSPPLYTSYLSETSKQNFLQNVNLSTTESESMLRIYTFGRRHLTSLVRYNI